MAIQIRYTSKGEERYRPIVLDSRRRPYPTQTFKRKIDAQRFERKLIARKEAGSSTSAMKATKITVSQYYRLWASKARRVGEGWGYTQDQMFRDYVAPIIGKMTLSDVKSYHIGEVIQEMKAAGFSDQTRKHTFTLMNSMFRDVMEYFKIPLINPASRRDCPEVIDVDEKQVLTPEESYKLLVETRSTYIGPAVWISLLSGPRPAEVQVLRWKHILFDKNVIRIVDSLKRKNKIGRKIGSPKNNRRDKVKPLIAALSDYLRPLSEGKSPEDFVCPGVKNEMLCYATFSDHLTKACKRAGVPRVTPHGLRHSTSEIWIENGATEEDIINILSHSDSSTVRRYIHSGNDRLLEIGSKIKIPLAAVIG